MPQISLKVFEITGLMVDIIKWAPEKYKSESFEPVCVVWCITTGDASKAPTLKICNVIWDGMKSELDCSLLRLVVAKQRPNDVTNYCDAELKMGHSTVKALLIFRQRPLCWCYAAVSLWFITTGYNMITLCLINNYVVWSAIPSPDLIPEHFYTLIAYVKFLIHVWVGLEVNDVTKRKSLHKTPNISFQPHSISLSWEYEAGLWGSSDAANASRKAIA
jgi:hypothetical protein